MITFYKGPGPYDIKIIVEHNGVSIDLTEAMMVKGAEVSFSAEHGTMIDLKIYAEAGSVEFGRWKPEFDKPQVGIYGKWMPPASLINKVK